MFAFNPVNSREDCQLLGALLEVLMPYSTACPFDGAETALTVMLLHVLLCCVVADTVAPSPLAMTIDNANVALPALLVARTVKLTVPAVVGVPEITPVVELSDKPAGTLPTVTVHVLVRLHDAVKVWLYVAPTLPFGSAAGVITMASVVT